MTLQTAAMETPMPAALALTEQVVLVTGGARGLGAAISRAFLREGARVVVNYHRSRDAALALQQEVGLERALALQADVTDPAAVAEMVAAAQSHFGTAITTVVNNARSEEHTSELQ